MKRLRNKIKIGTHQTLRQVGFLGHIARGHWPQTMARDAMAKYRLLSAAVTLSHRDA